MNNEIEITATLAKTNIDTKKATITLELEFSPWYTIPELANATGQFVNVVICPVGYEMD